MISVFQIFKMLIGIVIFIFLLIFFYQFSGGYADVKEQGTEYERVLAFDYTAMQVYTSGNSADFEGFPRFEFIRSAPPKMMFKSGQLTMSVPLFAMPDKGEMTLEKRCEDHLWFRFCWVYSYPKESLVLFTPIGDDSISKQLAADIAAELPDTLEFGYCSGTKAGKIGKEDFIRNIVNVDASDEPFVPCELDSSKYTRLVTIRTGAPTQEPRENEIVVDRTGKNVYETFLVEMTGTGYSEANDIYFIITGGGEALDFKRAEMAGQLSASAKILEQRARMMYLRSPAFNVQEKKDYPTPKPKECGWTDYDGNEYKGELYKDLENAASGLVDDIESGGDYSESLQMTESIYSDLKEKGCER